LGNSCFLALSLKDCGSFLYLENKFCNIIVAVICIYKCFILKKKIIIQQTHSSQEKARTNLDILLTKVHIVKAMMFPVATYGCESWKIKEAEHQRIDAFQLWCSILKEISPENSLEGQMLKMKLQYFGHLVRTCDSLEKTLMLRKVEGRRRRG